MAALHLCVTEGGGINCHLLEIDAVHAQALLPHLDSLREQVAGIVDRHATSAPDNVIALRAQPKH